MSRPRKPTPLHRLQGTYRPHRHGGPEPVVQTHNGQLPEWAELRGEAGQCWRHLAPILTSMQVLAEPDVVALVQLCRRYQEYREAAELVRAEGVTYLAETRFGTMRRQHPAVAIRDRAWEAFQRDLIEFGLTPASRSRVAPLPSQPADPFAALLDPSR